MRSNGIKTFTKGNGAGRTLALVIGGVAFAIALVLGIGYVGFRIVFRTYYMQAASMAPTLQKNDVVLVAKGAYRRTDPRDGDIVVFDPPVTSTNPFVKRVIGLPGESLRIHNGIVYRNGVALREPYVAQKTGYELEVANYGIYVDGERLDATEANIPPKAKWTSPTTIPPGCYILLGDNRNDSEDSHLWGFAESEDTYYTGEEAGKSAGFFEKVISIISPSDRARSLTR